MRLLGKLLRPRILALRATQMLGPKLKARGARKVEHANAWPMWEGAARGGRAAAGDKGGGGGAPGGADGAQAEEVQGREAHDDEVLVEPRPVRHGYR